MPQANPCLYDTTKTGDMRIFDAVAIVDAVSNASALPETNDIFITRVDIV